ncbi:MAG: J domain-containing protein [Hyphomicrobiales bacterium]|nr:J domain-containing protein [Hyphomicrobiales bacterium]
MKLDSKYFDSIRVKPDEDRLLRDQHPECDWQGCSKPALYPAPRGRGREGQFFHFCIDHVRQYNKSYNYFDGMSDDQVARYLKSSVTGHRPTWKVGSGDGNGSHEPQPGGFTHGISVDDLFGFFGHATASEGPQTYTPQRTIRNAERKCLKALNLSATATRDEIKARFKELVKRHHPDSNGGDRRSEDKLREVIQAYNYLKQAGLC